MEPLEVSTWILRAWLVLSVELNDLCSRSIWLSGVGLSRCGVPLYGGVRCAVPLCGGVRCGGLIMRAPFR